jgi:large subunit ribosomal protein L30
MAKKGTKSTKTISVTQIRSGIGRPEKHKKVLEGMGLGKMHRTVELPDTPESRGMIRKVIHLVEVKE